MRFPLRSSGLRARSGAAALGLLGLAALVPLTLASSAQAATPTPVLLGTSANFAVLAGSGITNTGVTTIVGDVGSSPTSTEVGFTPCPAATCVTLTGTNHTSPNPNDTATQNAKADLTTAYNTAAGQTPANIGTELAGQTLDAGIYNSLSGTFGMTGTLVLDGQNNPDAIFIFQTASTLITAGIGNVSLINGAQACNIFWQIGSSATLGAGSTLQGNVLANASISLGNNVTVDGRLLAGEQASGTGAVTLIGDNIIQPTTCLTSSTTTTTTPATTTTTATAATVAPAVSTVPVATTVPPATARAGISARAAAARAAAARAAAAAAATAKAVPAISGTSNLAQPAITHVGLTG